MAKKILMIDDDELIRESMEMIFSDFGIDVKTCGDPAQGVTMAIESDFDLILCDMRMPGLNGAQTVAMILEAKPLARIMVLTAFPGDPLVQKAMALGAIGLMKKPFEVAKMLDLLRD